MVLDDGTWGISPYIPHWSAACQVSLSYFISSATGSKSTPVQSSPLMPRHSSPFSSEPGPLIFLQGGQNVLFQSRSKSTIGQIKTSKINQNQWLSWSCNLLRSSPCKLEMINYSQWVFFPTMCCEAVSIPRPVPLLTVSGRLSLRFHTAAVSMFTSRWEAHNCSAISAGQGNLRRLSHQNSLYLLSQSPFFFFFFFIPPESHRQQPNWTKLHTDVQRANVFPL